MYWMENLHFLWVTVWVQSEDRAFLKQKIRDILFLRANMNPKVFCQEVKVRKSKTESLVKEKKIKVEDDIIYL